MDYNRVRVWVLFSMALLLLVATMVWAWSRGGAAHPQIRHVILISIDTTRADHFGCYGYDRPVTPRIDEFSKEAILFRNTVTPVPLTLPAHTSMFTGMTPPHHGKRDNATIAFDPSIQTLATLLKARGFRTGAFIGAQVLNRQFGLDRGFDVYQDTFANPASVVRSASEVNRAAFEWLDWQMPDVTDASLFMFLHYYDPHDPYVPPQPFATTFADHPYAGEIAWVDHCIGDVFERLKRLGMYESSLIIVTADHGEMLGEHGEDTHQFFIYQSALKVPMIIRLPKAHGQGTVVEDMAGIVDIMPTICELLQIEVPGEIEGHSLAGYLRNEPPPPADRYLYCESFRPTAYGANGLTGLTGNHWKYIHTTRPELYNLQDDPRELNNLIEENPRQAAILRENLSDIALTAARRGTPQQETPLDSELVQSLRTLGYVGETRTQEEEMAFDEMRDDPKDLIEFHNAWHKATHLWVADRPHEALAALEKAVNKRPVYELSELAALIYLKLEDFENAVRYGEMAVEERPHYYRGHEILAFASSFSGNDEKAAVHLDLALKLMPENQPDRVARSARLSFQLGMTRARQKKYDLAVQHLEQALGFVNEQPTTGVVQKHQVLEALANILLDRPAPTGNPGRALAVASEACALTSNRHPGYLLTLARAHAGVRQFDQAIQVSERAMAMARMAGDRPLFDELQVFLDSMKQKIDPGSKP